jgi:hypothetical protein
MYYSNQTGTLGVTVCLVLFKFIQKPIRNQSGNLRIFPL